MGEEMNILDRRLSVAPMMDWTDQHCRFFHRLYSPHALLYTEMLVAAAIVRGNAARLLQHQDTEHPVALQLGGCDPLELAAAARIGTAAGFDEINLNVGCPSDRVKSGAFGACLMLRPALVADCVRAMRDATDKPVTVKCRIGVDAHDDYGFFADFVATVSAAGVDTFIVHARSAILSGLSPKQNREIPPLRYEHAYRLKRDHPDLKVIMNGGISSAEEARQHLAAGVDGVMLGRAAYHRPRVIAEVAQALIAPAAHIPEPTELIERIVPYARARIAEGTRLHAITRHMHGLIAGCDGARAWRRFLSEVAAGPQATADTLYAALPLLAHGLAA